jgi:poly(hydroxyalkanoate) granule-associated protein
MPTTMKKESESTTLMQIPQELIERGREIAGRGHEVWLAGLGAFAAVEEEGTSLFNNLVQRGKKLEDTGRKRVDELREQVDERRTRMVDRLDERLYQPMMDAMKSFGVPTRREIRSLTEKVEALTRQVEVLVARMPEAAPVEYTVYYVMAEGEGWIVGMEGKDAPITSVATKDLALERARELAHQRIPSRLHVYRKDGSIQDTFTYEE